MSTTLRPYQSRAVDAARAKIQAGLKRVLVVGPTGCGKTVLFAHIVEQAMARGTRVLVTAHRRELIKQPWLRFVRAGLDHTKLGVVLAGVEASAPRPVPDIQAADDDALWDCLARRRPDAPVQVASIDTLRARAKPPADLVIVDEAHRMLSASYLKLADEYPNATFLGLTATPLRSDNKPLGDFYNDLVIVATYRELVAEGFLVAPRVFTVPASELPDLSRVRIKGGDYDQEQLTAECDKAKLVGSITEHWIRHGNDAPTFCFAVSREHSRHIAEQFQEAGVPAAHVDAETPIAERDAAIRKLKRGEIKVLCNVDVLTEGVDVPDTKTVILARPTKSVRVYLQAVGRGSRPSKSGKPFVVLDHAGVVIEHGLPHMIEFAREILWAPKSKGSLKTAPVKACPACLACVPASARVCDDCGHEFESEGKPRSAPEEEDGQLVEVSAPTDDDLRATWDSLCSECIANGFNPKWVLVRWGEMYPRTKPPAGSKLPDASQVEQVNADQIADLDRRVRLAIEKGHKPGAWKMGFKSQWHRYPSLAFFERTPIAKEIRAWLAGLERLMSLPMPANVEPLKLETARVVTPANDVELVDWAV